MSEPTTIWDATLTGAHGNIILSNNYVWDEAQFRLRDVKGWYGGVGVAGEEPQRVINHGQFERDGRRTGRIITLLGTFYFESDYDRHTAARYLSSLMYDGEHGELTVRTGDLVLTSRVRLDGEIVPTPEGKHVIKLSVPLIAADPWLYAPSRISQIFPAGFGQGLVYPLFATKKNPSGTPVLDWGKGAPLSAALGNEGNATAYPNITVYGDWPAGFTIAYAGKRITYPSTVDATTPVSINCAEGKVMVGDTDQTFKLKNRDWFEVAPRESFQPRIAALAPSNGWADVSLSSTYI